MEDIDKQEVKALQKENGSVKINEGRSMRNKKWKNYFSLFTIFILLKELFNQLLSLSFTFPTMITRFQDFEFYLECFFTILLDLLVYVIEILRFDFDILATV